MTKKQRITLFSICAILFLLSAVSVIFYSQGFRFDFAQKKIAQTGAFYFKVSPKNSQIYIDDKIRKRTDFLFNSSYIDNLLPRRYKVEIKKDGYFPWTKSLEVKEKEVTDARNIVLVNQELSFSVLASAIQDVFFAPDEKKIIFLERQGDSWELKSFNLEINIKSHILKPTDIAKDGADFNNLEFSPDSKRALLKAGLKEKNSYFLIDMGATPVKLTSLDFLGKEVEKIVFHPRDAQKLFLLDENKLKEGDLSQKKITPFESGIVLDFAVSDGHIYYLESSGHLYKTDLGFDSRAKISESPFPIQQETKYEIIVLDGYVFIKSEEKNLYTLDQEKKEFTNLLEKNTDLKISPDAGKIAYASEFEIWVLFPKEQTHQPQKKSGEKIFLTRFSEKIDNLFWFGSYYLIFSAGNKIKIAEIDDRDQINIVDLTEFKNPEMRFNQLDKKIYVFSEGKLLSSEPLF